ncbi:hypothetical protein GG344DRAFT_70442 [Lentinula edodes]|nr:hypothetical protein GG344DRAFT_70442 [Lentinula edodes]
MPPYMPVILEAMEINNAAVVDEICQYSGRRNLKKEGSGFPIYTGVEQYNPGQGVGYSSVHIVIYKDSQELINWYQESGSSWGVTDYRLSVLSFLFLQKIPWLLITSFDSTWLFSFGVWLVYERPYSLSDADVSRFSRKLVADIPHNPTKAISNSYIDFNKKVTHFIAVVYVYFKPLVLKEVAPRERVLPWIGSGLYHRVTVRTCPSSNRVFILLSLSVRQDCLEMGKGSFSGGVLSRETRLRKPLQRPGVPRKFPAKNHAFFRVGLAPGGYALAVKPLQRPDA